MLENFFVWLVSWFWFCIHIFLECISLSYVSKNMLTFLDKIQLSIKNTQQEKGEERPKVQEKSEEQDCDYWPI